MNRHRVIVPVLHAVVEQGRNLPDAIAAQQSHIDPADQPWVQATCYGVVRFYPRLTFLAAQLLDKPLKKKDNDIYLLILSGLYQLLYMRTPDHAVVSETVKVATKLKKPWAKNLINAVLRAFLRQQDTLLQALTHNPEAEHAHPAWWLQRLQADWPDNWQAITAANNQPPPMTLRLNTRAMSRHDYLAMLAEQGITAQPGHHADSAICLQQPQDVAALPLFAEGKVSVQDEAAQLAAILLNPQPGERLLDACAAPGGKTLHLLERQPDLDLLALDIENTRLDRIRQNLERSGLQAQLLAADALQPDTWWDGKPFDRILLDAPCSASGVIRRHPDIKLLRRAADIAELQKVQQQMLCALWPLLKSGGMLLYATCSVLKEENSLQVEHFLQHHDDAELLPLETTWGRAQTAGRQILPGEDGMDGFFYALIRKQ